MYNPQRQAEYMAAKTACIAPIIIEPGDDECEIIRKKIDKALRCIQLTEAFDAK